VKVVGAGVAALIEADLVEPGEPVVITGHQCQVLDGAGLVGHDMDIGGSPLAGETDVHRFAGAQVARPGKLRADHQGPVAAGAGNRDGVVPPGLAAHLVHGEQASADEGEQQRRAQQPAVHPVHQPLQRQGLGPRG
jgi:hypothetical protein